MKFYESKTAKFLSGKGFYIVLAVCMAVIGVAAYTTMEEPESSTPKISNEQQSTPYIPSVPTVPENNYDIPITKTESENSADDVDTEGEAPFYVLPIEGVIAKEYSDTALQYSETFKDMRIHKGIDITPSNGTVIVASFSGTVLSVEENTVYGTVITIDHGDGVTLKYCGVKNVTVQKGDMVDIGEIIAEIGIVANECVEKEHLHLELIINGEYADPLSLFP